MTTVAGAGEGGGIVVAPPPAEPGGGKPPRNGGGGGVPLPPGPPPGPGVDPRILPFLPQVFSSVSIGGGAPPRELRGLGYFNVLDYGAKGDGAADDTAPFIAALAAAGAVEGVVFVPDPAVGYVLGAELTIPANTSLVGSGKYSTRLIHAYNGVMINYGPGARMESLWLDGNGALFTGRGVEMFAGNGRQTSRSLKITDFADYCVDFRHEAAGSQSFWEDILIYQLSGDAAGEEAILIQGAFIATANPRNFIGIQTQGKRFIDLGPCNNLFIVASRVGGIIYNANSRGVSIVNCRLGTDFFPTMTILGANHSVDGCHVGPQIILGAGCSSCAIGAGNSYDADPPVVDNSGVSSNQVTHPRTAYTPTFATSGTAPALGNGTLTGTYTREGGRISFTIELTVGSTTTFGTGELRFGVPVGRVVADVPEPGQCVIFDSSAAVRFIAVAESPGATAYIRLVYGTGVGGLVSGTLPVALATGDTVRISGSYNL